MLISKKNLNVYAKQTVHLHKLGHNFFFKKLDKKTVFCTKKGRSLDLRKGQNGNVPNPNTRRRTKD